MVKQRKYEYIDEIRSPLHRFGRGFAIVELRCVFGREYIYQKRTDISNKDAGGCVETGGHHKIVKDQTGKKTDDH
jgi:hypothetical protein